MDFSISKEQAISMLRRSGEKGIRAEVNKVLINMLESGEIIAGLTFEGKLCFEKVRK